MIIPNRKRFLGLCASFVTIASIYLIIESFTPLDIRIRFAAHRCLGLVGWIASIDYSNAGFLKTGLPILRSYRLQQTWGTIAISGPPPLPCLVAVSPDRTAFAMPKDFQKVLTREHVTVTSGEDATALARTYVSLTSPYGLVVILDNLESIPGLHRGPSPSVRISPPQAQLRGSGYQVHLFAWKELGGLLEDWTLVIAPNAQIQAQNKRLAEMVGNVVGLR